MGATSHALRLQVEQSLAARISSAALGMRTRVEKPRVPCGIDVLDHLFSGGMPVGAITELIGQECSGRRTVAVSLIAKLMQKDTVSAWVDAADAFDPESAASNGVDLERLLWVRCRARDHASETDGSSIQQNVRSVFTPQTTANSCRGGGSPHPRSEGRGMSQAVEQLLAAHPRSVALKPKRRDRLIGTPGAPNRPLKERVEQVPWDRLPSRRGDNAQPNLFPRSAELRSEHSRIAVQPRFRASPHVTPARAQGDWTAIDQALRATDLLLQGGGFSAIVLDLGSTPAEQAWKIPLSSWFRFRAACERSQAILLVLTQHPCARSSAELVVHMRYGAMQIDARVMTGATYGATVERQRFPVESRPLCKPQHELDTHWTGTTAWARAQ